MRSCSDPSRGALRRTWVGAAALAALALSGCAGSSGGTTPAASAAASSTASGVPASPATAADQTIRVVYAGGKVSGVTSRVKVKLGSTVALVVSSDVADEVHLHGYDKHVDVAKGGIVTVTFTASIPGVFEAELESLKKRLVEIQVQ